ncbi:MAG TPA: ATP-binding protein [Bryobacteraceae bacterium]|jgi:PAS domain S-box-containing protein|nr:ATP-binding protein [Bryobacteraceae bacterium]
MSAAGNVVRQPSAKEQEIFSGGGELGELMRSLDWSKTVLASPNSWEPSLKAAVSICLNSRFPIVIFWGRDYAVLYNDSYIPILGPKHPWALGTTARECWHEIWDVIGPMLNGVLDTGKATWSEDLQLILNRNLPREEGYFTFSYSAIRTEFGNVGGVFCAVTETSERVINDRRLTTLGDLGARAAEAKTADEACQIASETLRGNTADVPFHLLYLVDGNKVRLAAGTPLTQAAATPQEVLISDPNSLWPFEKVWNTGRAQLVIGLEERVPGLPAGGWPEPCNAALVLPMGAPGQAHPQGFLVAGINPRRVFDAPHRSFFDLVAGNVGTALANAKAYEEEKRRAEALAELDRAKTVFFSNVSHEFRTPLTLLLGPLDDLLKQPAATLMHRHELLEVAHRNGLRLQKLVNTLLDFSRIEAGRVQAAFQPTDVCALTTDLSSNFRSVVENAGIQLVIDCPPLSQPVYLDREMWEKVVLNLLSNAFKFTFAGTITVALKDTGDHFEFSVADTGIGIPASELPRIFERFHRVEGSRGRTFEGTGIGLALVSELVKLHGGAISVQSEVDRGTTFVVSIPFGAAHLPQDQVNTAAPVQSRAPKNGDFHVEEALRWLPEKPDEPVEGISAKPRTAARERILLADDNRDMRSYLKRILGEDYEVQAAANGEEALAQALLSPPDLILSDVMMPRLDGFGLVEQLRARPETKTIPVILLSARAGEESQVEGLESGADDYLVKPFTARELLARVSSHLAMARMRRESAQSLATSEQRFRIMANSAPVMIWMTGPDKGCRWLNEPWLKFTGRTMEQGLGNGWAESVHPQDLPSCVTTFEQSFDARQQFSMELRLRRHDGEWRWVLSHCIPHFSEHGEFTGFIGSGIDITDRKEMEQQLQLLVDASGTLLASPNESTVVQTILSVAQSFVAADAYAIWRQSSAPEAWSAIETVGLSDSFARTVPSLIGNQPGPEPQPFYDVEEAPELVSRRDAYRAEGIRSLLSIPLTLHGTRSGSLTFYYRTPHHFTDKEMRLAATLANLGAAALGTSDIYERQKALRAVAEQNAQRTAFLAEAGSALASSLDYHLTLTKVAELAAPFFADWCGVNIIDGNGVMRRLVLRHAGANMDIARAVQKHFPASRNPAVRLAIRSRRLQFVDEISDSLLEQHIQRPEQLALIQSLGLRSIICAPLVARGRTLGVLTFATAESERRYTPDDVALAEELAHRVALAVDNVRLFAEVARERELVQKANQTLQNANHLLRRANDDLEQFAYSASHDLREPLRTVAVYTQLLKRHFGDKVDSKAEIYIGHTVSGARRMETLMNDLLSYVQAARGADEERSVIDSNQVLHTTISNLQTAIQESGASIVSHDLPMLPVHAVHLQQLLQNLIGNAIKYRSDTAPKIEISARRSAQEWIFHIKDNGIGIDPQYAKQVFGIFKRLHSSESYSGTGIGLAICQKIVERYGGRIWVESELGKGATFCFTLPVAQL